MNVDFNKSSPHTRILTDFIKDLNMYTCSDLPNANVQYTYLNPIIYIIYIIYYYILGNPYYGCYR